MKAVKLVRMDYRLIHGQVITKWNNIVHATDIIIVDDALVNDDFMVDIYTMASPPGVDVHVYTVDQFIEKNANGAFDTGNILVLLKKVQTLKDLMKKGVKFQEVQIGGLGGGKGRKQIVTGITISDAELEDLKEVAKEGISIYFQVTPEENKVSFDKFL